MHGNPVASAVRALIKDKGGDRFRLRNFLKARLQDLHHTSYYELSNIEEYAEKTYSTLLYMLLGAVHNSNNLDNDHVASHIGKAQGLVAFIRGALPLSSKGIEAGLPISLLVKQGISQQRIFEDREIWATNGMRNVIHDMAQTASAHIIHAEKIMKNVKSVGSRQCFLSIIPIGRYLENLYQHDFDLSRRELYTRDPWLPLILAWRSAQARFK